MSIPQQQHRRRTSTSSIHGNGSRATLRSNPTREGGTIESLRAAYMTPGFGSGGVQRRPNTAEYPPRLSQVQNAHVGSSTRGNRAKTAPPSQFRSALPKSPPAASSRYGYNRVQQYGTSSVKPPVQFSFIWALQNFAEIRQRATFMSQQFIDAETDAIWKLKVMLKQKDARDHVGVTLICIDVGEERSNKIKSSFEIAILDADEVPVSPCIKVVEDREFSDKSTWSCLQFVKFSDLDLRGNRLLVHDTLRIQCTLWRKKGEVSHSSVRPDKSQIKNKESEIQALRDTVNSFKQLLSDEKFADLKIITPMKTFNAHKVVLCARSKVFAAMLTCPMREKTNHAIAIKDFGEDAVGGMLEYLYSGEVTNLGPTAGDLLKLAEQYDLPGLRTLAEDSLVGNITLENVCDLLVLAHVFNASKLLKSVHKFISVRSKDIRKMPGYAEFVKKNPIIAFEVFLERR